MANVETFKSYVDRQKVGKTKVFEAIAASSGCTRQPVGLQYNKPENSVLVVTHKGRRLVMRALYDLGEV